MTEFSVIPEFSAQSKFQFVKAPLQQLPMKCAACYRYDDPDCDRKGHLDFLDFNLEFEFYGKFFLCVDCLREIINQLGWATEEQVKRAKNQIEDLLEQVTLLSEENENLRNAVGNLSTIAVGGAITGRDFMVGVEDGNSAIGGEGGDTESAPEGVKESGRPEPESDGPADEPGSTDLRDDDDLSKLLDEI